MYIDEIKRTVQNGQQLTWIMQGEPGRNAGLEVILHAHIIELQGGRLGIQFAKDATLPDEVDIVGSEYPYKGQLVWSSNQDMYVFLKFEDKYYQIITIQELSATQATLYFHIYPPKEFDEAHMGNIVYSEDQFLSRIVFSTNFRAQLSMSLSCKFFLIAAIRCCFSVVEAVSAA